ncbi:MAG: hypothetical protein KJ970_04355 [Candidatus Eisenbacteria bacterium]|uniref:Tetratricopeptide repeat protein n=1 Tax=Eiseniibacteriota bacterium TaxID=2212470 RepID=A0A948RVC0_UNCEI|nr:hypothetical protein [Candidatus Eisenbacteria bacterium]MBU1947744.1 hypothetical protein [Candidatus Eisenbacteria bacterium]MBU2690137.1 hypothetical protein [Candidatus Eisenbacteria bacterium]
MHSKLSVILSILAVTFLTPFAASAKTAEEAFAMGTQRLSKGDFSGAYEAYGEAVEIDGSKTEYRQEQAILHRVMKIREDIKSEKDPEIWERMAQSLRGYYYTKEIYEEALDLDLMVHKKIDSVLSATQLAETYLQLNKNADAEKILAGVDEASALPYGRLLYGIALGRQQKIELAKKVLENVEIPEAAAPGMLYQSARLYALTGNDSGAAAYLTRTLESIPPSRIETARRQIMACKDFAGLLNNPVFTKALETQSKVSESGCSGGTSCGNCPSRQSCGGSQSAPASSSK